LIFYGDVAINGVATNIGAFDPVLSSLTASLCTLPVPTCGINGSEVTGELATVEPAISIGVPTSTVPCGVPIGDAVTGTPSLAGLTKRPRPPPDPTFATAGSVLTELTVAGNVLSELTAGAIGLIESTAAGNVLTEVTAAGNVLTELTTGAIGLIGSTAVGNGLIDGLVAVEPPVEPPLPPLAISFGPASEPSSTTPPRPVFPRLLTTCIWVATLGGCGARTAHRVCHPGAIETAIAPGCCPNGMPVESNRRPSRTSHETTNLSIRRERLAREAHANFSIIKDIVLPSLVK
jgi:hypothetical protein